MKLIKFGDRIRTQSTVMIDSSGEQDQIFTYHPYGSSIFDLFRKPEQFLISHKPGSFYLALGAPFPCLFPAITSALESELPVYIELNQEEVLPTLIDLCISYGRKPYVEGFNHMFNADVKRTKKSSSSTLKANTVVIANSATSDIGSLINLDEKNQLIAFLMGSASVTQAARSPNAFSVLFLIPDGNSSQDVKITRKIVKEHYSRINVIFYPRYSEMLVGGLIKKEGISLIFDKYDNLGIVAPIKTIMAGHYLPDSDAVFCLQTMFDSTISTDFTRLHKRNIVLLPIRVDI